MIRMGKGQKKHQSYLTLLPVYLDYNKVFGLAEFVFQVHLAVTPASNDLQKVETRKTSKLLNTQV